MAWTLPTAMFFVGIAIALVVMTLIELRWPTVARRGWLPLATTRGDRFFIGLLSVAWLHIAWLALTEASILIASGLSVVVFLLVLRKA